MPQGIVVVGGRSKRTAGRITTGIDTRSHEQTRSDSANGIRTNKSTGRRQLWTNCWCELSQVWVNRENVMAGFTNSCGAPMCRAPWDLPDIEAEPAEQLKLPPAAKVHNRAWSPFDDAVLRSGVQNGLSYRKIGEALQKSLTSTYKRAQQLGWTEHKEHAKGYKKQKREPGEYRPRSRGLQTGGETWEDVQAQQPEPETSSPAMAVTVTPINQATYDRIAKRLKKGDG